jgi:hypothetical protein
MLSFGFLSHSKRSAESATAGHFNALATCLFLIGVTAVAACGAEVDGGSGGSGSTSTVAASTGGNGAGGCGPGFTGQSEWTSCDGPAQCTLRSATCCAGCGDEPIASMIAFRTDAYEAVTDAVCARECKSNDMCPPIGCPSFIGHNVAVCRSGSCKGVDVREDELSACTTSSDCTLRWGVHCCESCTAGPDSDGLVAVRVSPSLSEALCNPETPCPPCAPPPYPDGASAVCNAAGHCEVKLAN